MADVDLNDHELVDRLQEFIDAFVLVFDHDWEHTRLCMNDEFSIKNTFLEPDVADESNNWANRGALLDSFRKLSQCMCEHGVLPPFAAHHVVGSGDPVNMPAPHRANDS